MRELKIPGEVRQLVKVWRSLAILNEKHGHTAQASVFAACASELEAALKRPVKRAKILAKRGKK